MVHGNKWSLAIELCEKYHKSRKEKNIVRLQQEGWGFKNCWSRWMSGKQRGIDKTFSVGLHWRKQDWTMVRSTDFGSRPWFESWVYHRILLVGGDRPSFSWLKQNEFFYWSTEEGVAPGINWGNSGSSEAWETGGHWDCLTLPISFQLFFFLLNVTLSCSKWTFSIWQYIWHLEALEGPLSSMTIDNRLSFLQLQVESLRKELWLAWLGHMTFIGPSQWPQRNVDLWLDMFGSWMKSCNWYLHQNHSRRLWREASTIARRTRYLLILHFGRRS